MEIINAEYKEIKELDEKSTEELIAETNTLYQQMQTIGVIGHQRKSRAWKLGRLVSKEPAVQCKKSTEHDETGK